MKTTTSRRASWSGLPFLIAAIVMVSACSSGDPTTTEAATSSAQVRLLAIGDSVLEWNDDSSTPARAAALLNDRGIETIVDNRAVSGSCLGPCGDPDAAIASTSTDDGWTHLLVSGGGNDIDENCASADPVISEDLSSGLIIDLIDLAPASTTVLLYVYAPPIEPDDPLASCTEFDRLQARYRALAEARPGRERLLHALGLRQALVGGA